MEFNETSVLIDQNEYELFKNGGNSVNNTVRQDYHDLIAQVRNYNKEGPHYVYGNTTENERKCKSVRRLVEKNGKYNVVRKTDSYLWDKYLRDFSNTLVQSKWRWIITSAAASFIFSWLIFATIWMLISNANGDLEVDKPTDTPCLSGIKGFGGYFMFSLESQASIGYGSRYINHYCPEGAIILCMQIIFGSAICGLMVNIVYMKLAKPTDRYTMKLFSEKAVICRRDGELCLIVRVRDDKYKHAVGTTINAYLLRKEKEIQEPNLESLNLEPYGFLIWPLEIVHKITSSSPLWDISSYDLIFDKFELIVTLQGTSRTTGQCSKSRTSYLSSEILWGHRFKSCIRNHREKNCYFVKHQNFNVTEEHAIHLCSAKRFDEVYSNIDPNTHKKSNFLFQINVIRNQGRNEELSDSESIKSNDSKKCYGFSFNAQDQSIQSNLNNGKDWSCSQYDLDNKEFSGIDQKLILFDGQIKESFRTSNSEIDLNEKDLQIFNSNPYRVLKNLETSPHFMQQYPRSSVYVPQDFNSLKDSHSNYSSLQSTFEQHNRSNITLDDLEEEPTNSESNVDLDSLLASVEDYLEKNSGSNKDFRHFPKNEERSKAVLLASKNS